MSNNIIQLDFTKQATPISSPDTNQLQQSRFKRHERRSLGDIRTQLLQINFSKDPVFQTTAYPDTDGINNRMTLLVDVSDPQYQKIFGEHFTISFTKYRDTQSRESTFTMESPLFKKSGDFATIIHFVENFINTNLGEETQPIQALVAKRHHL